jgi:4'-phosphopantetheinyl transferase
LPVGDEVHCWHCRLDVPESALAACRSKLDSEELARADRFVLPYLRTRFAAAHAFVRDVLAGYLAAPAAEVRFVVGDHGKPRLDAPHAASGLQFNLSHSGDLAVLAVTYGRPVGVDVEQVRPLTDALAIARRFFTPEETAWLSAASPADLGTRFFRLWTRKEAVIKAVGRGLWMPLDDFATTTAEGQAPALLHLAGEHPAHEAWSLRDIEAPEGYLAAVVVGGGTLTVQQARVIAPG